MPATETLNSDRVSIPMWENTPPPTKPKRDFRGLGSGCLVIFFAVLVIGVYFGWHRGVLSWTTGRTLTIMVDRAERINKGSDSFYLVWGKTPDGQEEAFSVRDDWWRLHFNSSDTYGQLTVGKTFEVTVTGFRIPFFSMYRNIFWVKKE